MQIKTMSTERYGAGGPWRQIYVAIKHMSVKLRRSSYNGYMKHVTNLRITSYSTCETAVKAAFVRVFIVAKAQRDVALLTVRINTRTTHLAALSTFHSSPVRANNVSLFHGTM